MNNGCPQSFLEKSHCKQCCEMHTEEPRKASDRKPDSFKMINSSCVAEGRSWQPKICGWGIPRIQSACLHLYLSKTMPRRVYHHILAHVLISISNFLRISFPPSEGLATQYLSPVLFLPWTFQSLRGLVTVSQYRHPRPQTTASMLVNLANGWYYKARQEPSLGPPQSC